MWVVVALMVNDVMGEWVAIGSRVGDVPMRAVGIALGSIAWWGLIG